jgi:rod shape-determining protein MreC
MNPMPRVLAQRKPYLLLFLLLSLNLILMASSVKGVRTGSLLEETILSLAAPFFKAASWASDSVVGLWDQYAGLRGVEQQNRRLRAQVGTLLLEAREAEEARQEARRLRGLLDLRDESSLHAVAARVIARGAVGAARTILLGSGSHDGIANNQAVITPHGVVGRVIETAPGVTKVQTLLDPNSGVAALIQRTRVQGVVIGEGDESCRMAFVSELANVEVGDVVVTSGLDEIYPKGTIIGTVSEVGEASGLTRYVQVRPEVDFLRLEEVLVLTGAPATPSTGGGAR